MAKYVSMIPYGPSNDHESINPIVTCATPLMIEVVSDLTFGITLKEIAEGL